MSTRITQQLIVDRSMYALQAGMSRLAESQEHLTTGRLINRPSDSPTGTNDAMRIRGELGANEQYVSNARSGLDFLARTDSTLSSMVDNLQRARDLIVQGSSTGSMGQDARDALATELTQIKESLLSLADTQHMGRPLFGGTSAGPNLYVFEDPDLTDADTTKKWVFKGDDNEVVRTIGDGQDIAVNVTGTEAFGPSGSTVFDVLDQAIANMQSDPTQLGTSLAEVDEAMDRMLAAQADAGSRVNRIEAKVRTLADAELDHMAALSEIENVDIAKAVVDLQMQEVAYQAALGATARVLQPSLIDFLR
jgi:flagellar hook-associated protein 3 FlgL